MSTSLLLALAAWAGTAAGVFFDPTLTASAPALLAALVLVSFLAAARGYVGFARVFVVCAFVPLSALIAREAEHRAMHPPLRQFLEDRLGDFVLESPGIERHDEPVEIEGILTADAFATDAGASLRVFVKRASAGSCPEPATGGVSLTVVGVLAGESVDGWRAGRMIRATAALRRPAKYLNDGVPDQERLLARRGIALVGTVKSARLVQVVSRGSFIDETAASIRAAVKGALARHVGARDRQSAAIAVAILIGARGALDPVIEQRLQEAGTYHVIAISGGNIAIVAGLVLGAFWIIRVRGGWAAGAIERHQCVDPDRREWARHRVHGEDGDRPEHPDVAGADARR